MEHEYQTLAYPPDQLPAARQLFLASPLLLRAGAAQLPEYQQAFLLACAPTKRLRGLTPHKFAYAQWPKIPLSALVTSPSPRRENTTRLVPFGWHFLAAVVVSAVLRNKKPYWMQDFNKQLPRVRAAC